MNHSHCGRHRSIGTLLLALLAAGGCSTADSSEAGEDGQMVESEAPPPRTVPEGATLTFSVDQAVSTETHEVGDRFTATLRSDVADAQGETTIAAGTPSRWVVTQASTEGDQTVLAVELESVRIGGDWRPVAGTVTNADLDVDQADSDGETAAKIGVGAAAGALVGQILGGDTRSTLTGAGVGAAVGTAVALSTRSGKAVLPSGASITVQLSEPVVVS